MSIQLLFGSPLSGRAGLRPAALAAAAVCIPASAFASTDTNIGRYRFTTGTAPVGDAVGSFATDGKLGPENRWVPRVGGRPRLNVFFDRPSEIGEIHIYSGGERDGPVQSFSLQYRDENGFLSNIPGSVINSNTDWFFRFIPSVPLTTTQVQLTINDQSATIQEFAVFPPASSARPIGSGVDPHLARQHRLAFVDATSTASGSSRRVVVDGFVNNADFWRPTSGSSHTLTLEMSDPPETNPPTVRTETTPVEIGSVHLYSGIEGGETAIIQGRFQYRHVVSGDWFDVPGGDFSNNLSKSLDVRFSSPVTTSALRLVVEDVPRAVREVVPLPPNDGNGWPIGTGVRLSDAPDWRTYGDAFYTVEQAGSGLAMTSTGAGSPELQAVGSSIAQRYQVILNVGTDTYRVCNQATGLCLEPAGGSGVDGEAVVEAEYFGFPSQRWTMETSGAGVAFVNSATGHTLAAAGVGVGAGTVQVSAPTSGHVWFLTERGRPAKKGTGGWSTLASDFGINWAYNWGPDDSSSPFPTDVDFWPMQWGSFNWSQRPSLMPNWQRSPEPTILMGYNEPDKVDQSNMPVSTAAAMWPRLEVLNMPLLGPAVAGHPATSSWIMDFMDEVDQDEMRVELVGMHSYGGPSPDSFINKITSAWNTFGREVVVSEFSVVDWSDTNSWTKDPVYNFFAEVLWRMEKLPYLHRYAVFIFTSEPSNPISDNRGEMRAADGSLTPAGRLYAAWDGDTQLRTDTPYHLHNEGSFARIGAVPGVAGTGSIQMGDRTDDAAEFQWRLIPGDGSAEYLFESVVDGRVILLSPRGLELVSADQFVVDGFDVSEIQHGWFAIEEPALSRRLSSSGAGGAITLANPGSSSSTESWRFVPVFGGVPGPPRDGSAESIGGGQVALSWAEHGFRDLVGFNVYREAADSGVVELVAERVLSTSFVDQAPAPGTYIYTVTAVGDTGESEAGTLGTVPVATCPADFNGDFVRDSSDVLDAVTAIDSGADYNGDAVSDFFDLVDFLRVYDEGCEL